MDGNNDGKVTVGDLGRTQDKSRRTASKYATYRKLLIFLFGLFLAQMASTFAVMYGAQRALRLRSPVIVPSTLCMIG